MIYLIIKSYLIVLLFIAASVVATVLGGLYIIFKPRKNREASKPQVAAVVPKQSSKAKRGITNITSSDINAIAGDDVIATQLDLARAYIETGKEQLAKKILEYVVEKGDFSQKQEARDLLGYI